MIVNRDQQTYTTETEIIKTNELLAGAQVSL